MKIQEIIYQECMPRRDCMLTVQDTTGEAGFLYFKDAELIEANCANRWGQDALGRVAEWQIAEYFVAPLPLGIKRSLWGSIEKLFSGEGHEVTTSVPVNPGPDIEPEKVFAEGIEQMEAEDEQEKKEVDPYASFREISGLLQLGLYKNTDYKIIHNNYPEEPTSVPDWLPELLRRANSLGEMIGFGRVVELGIASDLVHVVGFSRKQGLLLIVRQHEASLDELETACRSLLVSETR
jgi:hypothetical protein